jgi:hypothetical protein
VRSRDWIIDRNVFLGVRKPLKIANSETVAVNGENLFHDFEQLLVVPKPNKSLKFFRNDLYGSLDNLNKVWKDPLLSSFRTVNFSHEGSPDNPYAPLDIPLVEAPRTRQSARRHARGTTRRIPARPAVYHHG